jgi:hypothetical protein
MPPSIVEGAMSKVIGATAFVLAAAGFARWGDPIVASLLAVCAVVWGAAVLVPLRDPRLRKRGSVPRLE